MSVAKSQTIFVLQLLNDDHSGIRHLSKLKRRRLKQKSWTFRDLIFPILLMGLERGKSEQERLRRDVVEKRNKIQCRAGRPHGWFLRGGAQVE